MQVWFERITLVDHPRSSREATDIDRYSGLKVGASRPVLDIPGRRMSVDVHIENVSPTPIDGPFTLVLKALNSGLNFFQAEDGIRDSSVTGVQTCALPI